MAHFDSDELIDVIRHNLILLDDTGLTEKVIPPPQRRAPPPGGFPLEMCRNAEDASDDFGEEEEEQQCSGLTSLLHQLEGSNKSEPGSSEIPLRDQVRARLQAKLQEMEQNSRLNWATLPAAQRPTQCTLQFQPKEVSSMVEESASSSGKLSMTARLLAETKPEENQQSFAEFAKFEAMAGAMNSKHFDILVPFADQSPLSLPINIVRTAYISDLIGLACHLYTRERYQPDCGSPSEYDLYLAEDNLGDFDTELPPQDRRRRVAECGFPHLAMVRRAIVNRRPSQRAQHQIQIFLVDGRCYKMDAENFDISLRQVFEYAMERKREEEEQIGTGENSAFFRKLGYVLEPLDQPGLVLDLNGSVSSSGTTDFVLLRMNSARGECLERQASLRRLSTGGPSRHLLQSRSMEFSWLDSRSKPSSPVGTTELDWATKRRKRFSIRQPSSQQQLSSLDSAQATLGRRSGAELAKLLSDQSLLDGGDSLEEYQVNRIHRFQPKAPTRMIVRERLLELVPIQPVQQQSVDEPKKKPKSPATKSGKVKRIPWELVAAVEVPPNSEQRANARRIVRIISLGGTSPAFTQQIIESGKVGRPVEGNSAYDGSYWKTILVEAAAHEAWQIGVRLAELLDSRPSQVHMLYHYSAGASLKPSAAAEKAFGGPKALLKLGLSPGDSSVSREPSISGEKAPKKKLSMIFARKRL